MNQDGSSTEKSGSELTRLDAHDDARALVRLVQCKRCSRPFRTPVTLPCGASICRQCLPESHEREGITYPNSPEQREVITCPLPECGQDHPRGNCGLDVCTLAFPGQPTFLRIFEPRYRLMLRRCVEGNREFGMLMYNRYNEPQGDLGHVHFWRYGTMLKVGLVQPLPDGTSIVETTGIYRFRVSAHGVLDGYAVGSVERVEDVPLDEEQRIEAEETSRPPPEGIEGNPNPLADLDRMPTEDLFRITTTFVARMRERSAHWLAQRVLDAHGHPPNDPATFPFWFAAVLPFVEEEKYKLLSITSVRERLKVTATWVRRIESQRCFLRYLESATGEEDSDADGSSVGDPASEEP